MLTFHQASEADAAAVASVRLAAARDLSARFGAGAWSFAAESEGGIRIEAKSSYVLIARDEGLVVATLRLSTRNPWLGDTSFFTPSARPVFLTSMAVKPTHQRCGIGRACLEQAREVAQGLHGDAIRLDSYDARAGAGDFYRKCGYRAVRRGEYHGTPLIWFELLFKPGEQLAGGSASRGAKHVA